MGKDKKKSKVGFQFTALQKRIKLLNAKVLLLEEKNRGLEAKAREEWRHEASQEVLVNAEIADKWNKALNPEKAESYTESPKPWWKRLF